MLWLLIERNRKSITLLCFPFRSSLGLIEPAVQWDPKSDYFRVCVVFYFVMTVK